jgi:hypothetical protein
MSNPFTLAYFWSNKDPESQKVAEIINASPYGEVISTLSVDSPDVRNLLMFGNYPQASVPFYIVQEGSNFFSYPPSQARKVLNLAEKLIVKVNRNKNSSESSSARSSEKLGSLGYVSSQSAVSREETDDENSNIPSILNASDLS